MQLGTPPLALQLALLAVENNIGISAEMKSRLVPMLETRLMMEETPFTVLSPCFRGEVTSDITAQSLAMWQTLSIAIFSGPHHLSSHNSSSP